MVLNYCVTYPCYTVILMSCLAFGLSLYYCYCFYDFCLLPSTCMLSVLFFFRLFSFSVALPNTRRSVSRPEQVRQAGSVGDQEQDARVAVLVSSRLHQGLDQTRAVTFSAREYGVSAVFQLYFT